MSNWFFVSDLHGRAERYRKLWEAVAAEQPEVLLLGGDLLPHAFASSHSTTGDGDDYIHDFLAAGFARVREVLGGAYPRVLVILGNDDGRSAEASLLEAAADGLWEYIHFRRVSVGDYHVFGYSFVPPTPFLLKDWERYDVSRYVDPGCVPPEAGYHSVAVTESQLRAATIAADLVNLADLDDLGHAVFLLHGPPYRTSLDRAALDGRVIDHAPVDVHVGSVAMTRFIETRQPLLTLHGHIHESARLCGTWREQLGRTWMFTAAHDGPELALVRFDPARLAEATRTLL
ncbi:MAG TPA: metallophosphoesterase [Phycisphaerae bacterium]|nr:metallophosphoesterase [Phycisphaerae bacterium]HNU45512.1 metallophosphoesterase [Phycisphaerae bacterium]